MVLVAVVTFLVRMKYNGASILAVAGDNSRNNHWTSLSGPWCEGAVVA